ncbi:uncharacterized protein BDR25DRAFT_359984 [Lindgomyces ingoldianus]|uniref:Uncharacterized protein n=1 Tax=Lindgomyces ingoldianus TaxID=673940 RepID=A0ACB6QJ85_9PLEO|nr:uncharacterized protein BDR25DRAFT_359984 [Lindgomyces ingoldianus]KAF2466206.1 hypothetical protein BDR25DRAFT_359984 [Lindgomyces ingoldianus]
MRSPLLLCHSEEKKCLLIPSVLGAGPVGSMLHTQKLISRNHTISPSTALPVLSNLPRWGPSTIYDFVAKYVFSSSFRRIHMERLDGKVFSNCLIITDSSVLLGLQQMVRLWRVHRSPQRGPPPWQQEIPLANQVLTQYKRAFDRGIILPCTSADTLEQN